MERDGQDGSAALTGRRARADTRHPVYASQAELASQDPAPAGSGNLMCPARASGTYVLIARERPGTPRMDAYVE
jgi:hypothetical protein